MIKSNVKVQLSGL